MDRRRLAQVGLAVVLVLGVVVVGVRWWTRPRLVEVGDAVVVVEGHDFSLSESYAGVGYVGRLRLVGDRCVGFDNPTGTPIIAVFPVGTTVSGSGLSTMVTYRGATIRVGDHVDVGMVNLSEDSRHAVVGALPGECGGAGPRLIFPGG